VPHDWPVLLLLVLVGAVASAINAVAGGGSLVSFPTLTLGLGLPLKPANATNTVSLWPGSLAGAFGFWNLIGKTGHHFKTLALPTLIGALAGAWLLVVTHDRLFQVAVPFLLLGATLLLAFQPHIKHWAQRHRREISPRSAILLQLGVAVYGGYFGAGMGIMMLAVFTLFMEGTIHEINAVKNWLGVIINFVATMVFVLESLRPEGEQLILWAPALALTIGSIFGGFAAARMSQRVDSEKMRKVIAGYGFVMTAYFFSRLLW
jgi:uncharacterized protein